MKNKRPSISAITKGEELKQWYWLKEELVRFCKLKCIHSTGSKFEILDRIACFLDNKSTTKKIVQKTRSNFDWHKEPLMLKTKITGSYKNTQNVRRFFTAHCGIQFHFTIPFMAWMKENIGENLNTAVLEWMKLNRQSKDKNVKTIIPPHNQYNQYIRDFFEDNQGATLQQIRRCWKLKRSLPLHFHKYEKTDLRLK